MPTRAGRLRMIAPRAVVVSLLLARTGVAEEPRRPSRDESAGETRDRFSVSGQSETYVQLYKRALLPGQNGQAVPTETAVPVTEYLYANACDVDAPWQKDAIGMEFAAWGRAWPTSSSLERPFDGDVQTANVRLDAGPAWARVGRQQIAGGAARFARFDGVMAGARHAGFFAEGYGGFTVLPRWDARMGYHQLGSQEDTLLTYQPAPSERHSHWLAGGRLGYQMARVSGSVSFHDEQVQGGVDHRNLGLDLGVQPLAQASLGASGLLELDSGRFGQARLWVDATPHPIIDVSAEFLHAEPALLLSRQSIFSVFTTDSYEEFGGTLSAKALAWLRFDAQGYVEAYAKGDTGARGELAARIGFGRVNPTLFRVAVSRVMAPQNGYRGVRASFSRKLTTRLSGTLEAYGYFYDQPISGYTSSSVYAGTASYRVLEPLDVLWSVSLAQSPYAALDAQTMLRVAVHFDAPSRPRFP